VTVFLLLTVIGLTPGTDSINGRVVEFAVSKVGQGVASGECTALATEVLRELKTLGDVRPGDIIQPSLSGGGFGTMGLWSL
jgi:hypothetical protein